MIIEARFFEMIASSDDSTIAASLNRLSSTSLRSVVSRIALVTK